MATALEVQRMKSSALEKVRNHRNTVRRVVDTGEMGAGALLGGVLDTKLPDLMGAKPSLLIGVALLAGGAAMSQRDMMAGGIGMVIPHLYGVGQGLAASV